MNVFVEENDLPDLIEFDAQVYDPSREMDLLVTIGGDGTVLHGMSRF